MKDNEGGYDENSRSNNHTYRCAHPDDGCAKSRSGGDSDRSERHLFDGRRSRSRARRALWFGAGADLRLYRLDDGSDRCQRPAVAGQAQPGSSQAVAAASWPSVDLRLEAQHRGAICRRDLQCRGWQDLWHHDLARDNRPLEGEGLSVRHVLLHAKLGASERRMAYRDNRYAGWTNGWRDHRSWNKDRHSGTGFWPADVAAGVVGGAIDTAGALVTAPFRAANAYYDGYYDGDWNQSHAAPNGFVCNSGTWYRQEDGVWHRCR